MADLVDRIVGGMYAAGLPLPNETDRGTAFGVSRTVVRESVKLLQDRGLVRSHQGIGTVVQPFGAWDLIDDLVLAALVRHDESRAILDELVEVRAGLERDMAAGAALARATWIGRAEGTGDGDPALRSVLAAYERMTGARDDTVAFGLADVEFHDAVMVMSGNRLGRQLVTRIHDKARSTDRYHGAVTAPLVEATLAEHQRVRDAIAAGDPAAAAAAMHADIAGSWDRRRPRRPSEGGAR